MPSIDERIVSMTFENRKFEAGVAKTMASLAKLNESLKLSGAAKGLQDIDKAANKVTFSGAGQAADKLKGKMEFSGAIKGLQDIEGAASKVTLEGADKAADGLKGKFQSMSDSAKAGLDSLKEKFSFPGADRAFASLSSAASRVNFNPIATAIEKIKGLFHFGGAPEKAFANIDNASSRVSLPGISNAVSAASKQFSILEGAAAVALGNIATKAYTASSQFAKSFTIAPIKQGFAEYSTNLNSIQTVLANTADKGSTLKDVNAALSELNTYSDKTIYNFSEMAKNIGTFTAAGVDLNTATGSIKGIANLAALSGSNSQQASTAMYQLSQAISSGRVSLQDWNSVVNAGMGGAVFQKNLVATAVAMGTLNKSAVKIDKTTGKLTVNGQSFREAISAKTGGKSFLTSEVLTNSLQTFTGDLTDAQLAAKGFSAESIKAIQKQAKSAQDAATKVKTIAQVIDVAKETLGSGYAKTFQLLFGDFGQAKVTFTQLSNAINGLINKSADARNAVLTVFGKLGGREKLIESLKNIFKALGAVLKPIGAAFREIFPAKTGKDLYELATRFADFTEKLKIGPKTAEDLKRTFAGLFAILGIGKTILGAVTSVFFKLLGVVGPTAGGFLNFTGSLGDFLVSIDKALKSGRGFSAFFEGLPGLLQAPLTLLGRLRDAITNLFAGGSTDGVTDSLGKVTLVIGPLRKALGLLNQAWENFKTSMNYIGEKLGPIAEQIGGAFVDAIDAIKNVFKGANFDDVFKIIQTGLIGGIFLAIKKALGGGLKIDLGGGVLSNMSKTLDTLNGSLKALQRNIQADTLLKIASALAVLAAAVVALSFVKADRLASAMTAIAVGLGQLVGALALLQKGGIVGAITILPMAAALVILAGALVILAGAVTLFSKLDWDELARGLTGVAGVLAAVGVSVGLIPKSIVFVGPALIPLAIALNLMAIALKIFATLSWTELAKGLIGVGGGLAAIGIGLNGMSIRMMLAAGKGLVGLAAGLILLSIAVNSFGSMDLVTMGKGLLGIGSALTVIGYAIAAIPKTVALQAAGLIVLSVALTGIAAAVGLMGGMKMTTIAKGLIGIGASLSVLAQGLYLMIGTLPGAAALVAAATGLAILVPALGILGAMNWGTILKSLGALALTLGILGVVGLIAGPGLVAVGVGLLAVGIGLTAIGAGVYLAAKGISLLAKDGQKGVAAFMIALTGFVALLPTIVINFVKGLVEIAASIAKIAPLIVDSLVTIINSLLDVIIQAAPKIAIAAGSLILAFLTVLNENAGPLITAGLNLLLNFLNGLRTNIGEIVTLGAEIVTTFLSTLAAKLPDIMAAGANVLIQFLAGVATTLPRVIAEGVRIVTSFFNGITQGLPQMVTAGSRVVVTFLSQLAARAPAMITAGANLIIKVLEGMGNNSGRVARAAAKMVGTFLSAAAQAMLDLVNKIGRIIVNFLNGIADAINKYAPQIERAGYRIASAIINGITGGLGRLAGKVTGKIGDVISSLPKIARKILKERSPSKVFHDIGMNTMLGLAQGLNSGSSAALQSADSTANSLVNTMAGTLRAVPDILDGLVDMDPVIAPVLDLSSVESEAKKLDGLTNVTPITAAASYDQASSISAAQEAAAQLSAIDPSAVVPPQEIKFEQNNYSPEALSAIEVYRQTKNQLGLAKRQLGVS